MTDYEFSEHSIDEMEADGITEDEVKACLEHGTLEIKQLVKGELRFGKRIQFKDKAIIVIYTKREDRIRIITVYPIRRKKWQNYQ